MVSVLIVLGTLLFVRASYPSDKPNSRYILPVALCSLQCCCSEPFLKKHLANDWLAGCWIFFWGTLLATGACLVLTAEALSNKDSLLIFIYATAVIENLFFLVGAAYWVSGSYPESLCDGEDGREEEEDGNLQCGDGTLRSSLTVASGGALYSTNAEEDYILISDSSHSHSHLSRSRNTPDDTITM